MFRVKNQQKFVPTLTGETGLGRSERCSSASGSMPLVVTCASCQYRMDFKAGQGSIQSALEAYVAAVKGGAFPSVEHGYSD